MIHVSKDEHLKGVRIYTHEDDEKGILLFPADALSLLASLKSEESWLREQLLETLSREIKAREESLAELKAELRELKGGFEPDPLNKLPWNPLDPFGLEAQRESMCPHCGWRCFASALDHGLIPTHRFEDADCPGSLQGPRNPESDRRPLWKDLPKEVG